MGSDFVWSPTLFTLTSCMFCRRKKVWKDMRVNKRQNLNFGVNLRSTLAKWLAKRLRTSIKSIPGLRLVQCFLSFSKVLVLSRNVDRTFLCSYLCQWCKKRKQKRKKTLLLLVFWSKCISKCLIKACFLAFIAGLWFCKCSMYCKRENNTVAFSYTYFML